MKKPNIEKLEVGMEFKSLKELVIFTGMATKETYQPGGTNVKNYKDRLRKVGVRFENVVINDTKKRRIVITDIVEVK